MDERNVCERERGKFMEDEREIVGNNQTLKSFKF